MEKKYILTDETIEIRGCTLHRIQAIKDFGDIKAGDLGGWIESEENLSHEGVCWVYGEAKIFENARVYGDAWVFEDAWVFGRVQVFENARVYNCALAYGNALVYGNARVYNDALICGSAQVYRNAWVFGRAKVYGDARICGSARIYNDACVYGNARVCGNVCVNENAKVNGNTIAYGDARICKNGYVSSPKDYIFIAPLGSRDDCTTFYKTKNGSIWVTCGCFNGSIKDFERAVKETHGDKLYAIEYIEAIRYARFVLVG